MTVRYSCYLMFCMIKGELNTMEELIQFKRLIVDITESSTYIAAPNVHFRMICILYSLQIGRQGMLTPPRHLIPPLVFPGVCVCRDAYSA
jgi:hypothetical protein